jgi:2',3'-cyclic-nucleotide 2'-phosphodiesterase (5'-nucleotidase family)
MTDLFDYPELWPQELHDIFDSYDGDDEADVKALQKMLIQCEAIGYTFDFGLNAVAYGLKKI